MRGRPTSSKRLWVQHCLAVGIAKSVRRKGDSLPRSLLIPGLYDRTVFLVISSNDGRHSSRIRVRVTTSYPNFGGVRYWYVCPRCQRRSGKLYALETDVLGCRVCLDLVYKSQYRKDSMWARLCKLYF